MLVSQSIFGQLLHALWLTQGRHLRLERDISSNTKFGVPSMSERFSVSLAAQLLKIIACTAQNPIPLRHIHEFLTARGRGDPRFRVWSFATIVNILSQEGERAEAVNACSSTVVEEVVGRQATYVSPWKAGFAARGTCYCGTGLRSGQRSRRVSWLCNLWCCRLAKRTFLP